MLRARRRVHPRFIADMALARRAERCVRRGRRITMRALVLLFGVMLGLSLGPGAALADASGKALDVDQDARAETGTAIKQLTVGADIFIGDRVITDARGLVQVKFSDSTKLVVGPNSALLIEDYLLRGDGSGGKFAINALSGTFRFVTGGAPKDRYLIETPTGTIGVRGTGFDFNVRSDQFSLMLYHGAVVLCNRSNQCVTVDDACEVGVADLRQAQILGIATEMTQAERDQLRSIFPYAVNEAPLLGQFRIAQARDCLNRPVTPTVQDPVSEPGGRPQLRERVVYQEP
jgi:hypothetical protein